jgi:uncharacterized SAM-binding protein YcdF (DUF218 family)
MSSDRLRRTRRVLLRAAAVVAALTVVAALCFLPFAGRYLLREDPLDPSDAILVLAGARVERWLEAVELFREGWAPRIVLSRGGYESADSLLREMGLHYPDEAELARDLMIQMHVPSAAIILLPGSRDNTAQEAEGLHEMATSDWRHIIVVTSNYHTRRAGFAFRREFRHTPVQVIVRGSRYDSATPARWWRARKDIRFVTLELQKLVLYWCGLGG